MAGPRGNIEGAALFDALAPAGRRARTIRALVAFQTAYNYFDALSGLPSEDGDMWTNMILKN